MVVILRYCHSCVILASYQVKPLGVLAMIDDGELDWKVGSTVFCGLNEPFKTLRLYLILSCLLIVVMNR